MESIAYATVINTVINLNRSGHWPCHQRYADKPVTLKARHCKVPKRCFKLPRQLRDYMLELRGLHHFSRVVFGEVFCRAHFGIK